MRLVMMGTGPFAVPTFRALYETHHTVVALVTRPVRRRHGRRPVAVSPMRDVAHERGTPLFDPEDVNAADSITRLLQYKADLLVVCDYGQILSTETLATASLGGINLHASLLPKYRGAAPINWAIYNGDEETGVTVIHMTPRVDAGPCIAQGPTLIDPDETAEQLETRLAEVGAWLVRRALDNLESGRLEALPQDTSQACKAPRLKKTDGRIDWNRPAVAIKNQIRAMEPWPKTYTFLHCAGKKTSRLILGLATVVEGNASGAVPGTIVKAVDNRLTVACAEGAVELAEVQPSGKRMMSVEEFLRGHPLGPADRFGGEESKGR